MRSRNMLHASALVLLTVPVQAEPMSPVSRAFNPVSKTATAITGLVIASDERVVFETGAVLALDLVDGAARGK